MIAGDLNNNGTYDEIEMIYYRFLILGTLAEVPNSTSWKFAPESSIPATIALADEIMVDECMSFDNFPNSDTTIAVVGIKTGDINFSAQLGTIVDTTDLIPNPLVFRTDDRAFAPNDTFTISFYS